MNKDSDKILYFVQAFFSDYLVAQRGVSPHTIRSYRDALKLFLNFVSTQSRQATTKLTLKDFCVDNVLAFLNGLETSRKNNAITRNHRLTALKCFFSYLATQDVLCGGDYQKVVSIPLKRSQHRLMEYLEKSELTAILKTIDRNRLLGERDYVLLNLMYNTGARVQEICDLQLQALRLDSPPSILITGKGRKVRQVPLWPSTVKLLSDYLHSRQASNQKQDWLFVNQRGDPLSRFGVRHMIQTRVSSAQKICHSLRDKKIGPHTFRHTTAMHLLQSGVDLTVIKTWLGHVNLSTTHTYVEIDIEMKRKALSNCRPIATNQELKPILDLNKDVIHWLESL